MYIHICVCVSVCVASHVRHSSQLQKPFVHVPAANLEIKQTVHESHVYLIEIRGFTILLVTKASIKNITHNISRYINIFTVLLTVTRLRIKSFMNNI